MEGSRPQQQVTTVQNKVSVSLHKPSVLTILVLKLISIPHTQYPHGEVSIACKVIHNYYTMTILFLPLHRTYTWNIELQDGDSSHGYSLYLTTMYTLIDIHTNFSSPDPTLQKSGARLFLHLYGADLYTSMCIEGCSML